MFTEQYSLNSYKDWDRKSLEWNLVSKAKDLGKLGFDKNFCFREDCTTKNMLVDLGPGALESIVKDGVKEILCKVVGGVEWYKEEDLVHCSESCNQ